MQKIIGLAKKTIKKFVGIYKTIISVLKENETREQKIETLMVSLILGIMVLSLMDAFIIDNIVFTAYVEAIDLIVCGIFAVDLVKRYINREGSRWDYFKKSWLEIIAIIPLDMVFRYFRIVRIVRVMRMGRVAKLGRFANTFMKIFKSAGFMRYKRFNKILMGYGKSKMQEHEEEEQKLKQKEHQEYQDLQKTEQDEQKEQHEIIENAK